jgi:hypothetical protein
MELGSNVQPSGSLERMDTCRCADLSVSQVEQFLLEKDNHGLA